MVCDNPRIYLSREQRHYEIKFASRRKSVLLEEWVPEKYLFNGSFAARRAPAIRRRSAERSKWHSVYRMRVSTVRDRGIVFPRAHCRRISSATIVPQNVAEMPQVYLNLRTRVNLLILSFPVEKEKKIKITLLLLIYVTLWNFEPKNHRLNELVMHYLSHHSIFR